MGYGRLVLRARALGFSSITGARVLVTLRRRQIKRARVGPAASKSFATFPGVNLTFECRRSGQNRLPESDASVDLTLCLYSALSHLPVASLKDHIDGRIARVTSGHFITTVRSGWKHSDGVCRFGRECPTPETGITSGTGVKIDPQRWADARPIRLSTYLPRVELPKSFSPAVFDVEEFARSLTCFIVGFTPGFPVEPGMFARRRPSCL